MYAPALGNGFRERMTVSPPPRPPGAPNTFIECLGVLGYLVVLVGATRGMLDAAPTGRCARGAVRSRN